MLDFGSGSGILAIAAVKLGATAFAVEIDPDAVTHAKANAAANGACERIDFQPALEETAGEFELVVANILRDVLISSAVQLVNRVAPQGTLVLSGLMSTDVPIVQAHYSPLLQGQRPEISARGEWRALTWRSARHARTTP